MHACDSIESSVFLIGSYSLLATCYMSKQTQIWGNSLYKCMLTSWRRKWAVKLKTVIISTWFTEFAFLKIWLGILFALNRIWRKLIQFNYHSWHGKIASVELKIKTKLNRRRSHFKFSFPKLAVWGKIASCYQKKKINKNPQTVIVQNVFKSVTEQLYFQEAVLPALQLLLNIAAFLYSKVKNYYFKKFFSSCSDNNITAFLCRCYKNSQDKRRHLYVC